MLEWSSKMLDVRNRILVGLDYIELNCFLSFAIFAVFLASPGQLNQESLTFRQISGISINLNPPVKPRAFNI